MKTSATPLDVADVFLINEYYCELLENLLQSLFIPLLILESYIFVSFALISMNDNDYFVVKIE